MRFTKKKQLINDYVNDRRTIVTKFLFFPLELQGETRWLEMAEIEYKVVKKTEFILDTTYYKWIPFKFLNK
jgi:hypothetical protein